MKEGNTWSHCKGGFGERERELAEVFYSKRWGDFGVVIREANFFPSFSSCNFERGLFEGIRLSTWQCRLACFRQTMFVPYEVTGVPE
jgi:hypothetical protein